MESQSPTDHKWNTPRSSIHYLESITAVVRAKWWIVTLFVPMLVFLPSRLVEAIPYLPYPWLFSAPVRIAEMLVFQGYIYHTTRTLFDSGGKSYELFDVRKLPIYVHRTIAYILCALIVILIILADELFFSRLLFRIRFPLGAFVQVPIVSMLLWMFLQPLVFRAGCSQNWRAAFDWRWGVDFLRRMWLEVLLTSLFQGVIMVVCGIPIYIFGILLVRNNPTIAGLQLGSQVIDLWPLGFLLIQHFVVSHLMFQLFEVYEHRGGVPFKYAAADPSKHEEGIDFPPEQYTPDPANPYASPTSGGSQSPREPHAD